jgi:putative membrane protein
VIARILGWWVLNTVILWVATLVVGSFTASGFGALAAAGLVLGLLNMFLKPILKIIGLPLAVITLGLSLFAINVIVIALTAFLVPGLDLGGFWSAVEVTVVVWLVSLAAQFVVRPR